MDGWVTTRDASKKVGLTQHRIAERAKHEEIEYRRVGKKKYLVKVTFSNGIYELVERIPPVQTGQAQVVTELPPKERSPDIRLREHFDQLAVNAEILASRVQKLTYYKGKNIPYRQLPFRGNIIDGLRSYWASSKEVRETRIESSLARCVFVHYEHKFGKSPYGYWEDVTIENVSQELADNLLRLASSKAFEPCPKCPVCLEVAGIEPVSSDSIPIPDEKTGKVTYMPKDF